MLLYIWSVEKTCNMTGGNRMKVLIVGAGGQGGSCASIPVSYTHLDVYKRQKQGRMYRGLGMAAGAVIAVMLI